MASGSLLNISICSHRAKTYILLICMSLLHGKTM